MDPLYTTTAISRGEGRNGTAALLDGTLELTLASPVETFKIALRDDGGNKGTLALDWETTEAYIPLTVSP